MFVKDGEWGQGASPVPRPAEDTLLRCGDLACALRLLRADCLSTGLELLRRIQERLLAILQHSTQVCAACPPTCCLALSSLPG